MEYYSQQAAAQILGVTPRTLLRWLHNADMRSASDLEIFRQHHRRSPYDGRERLLSADQVAALADRHKRHLRPADERSSMALQVSMLIGRITHLEQARASADPQDYDSDAYWLRASYERLSRRVDGLQSRVREQRRIIKALQAQLSKLLSKSHYHTSAKN
jgi:predicted RNase H-like nuclease (RuvC/YqgF family)